MSYSPDRPGTTPTDADAANDAIRALVDGADGQWPAEEYERLLADWAAAVGDGAPLPATVTPARAQA
ncbi:hypothetical protein ACFYM2_14785 [Streptomyces sp. NPDC006711]|uniref:hypothetical protein n=1 Tax=Streptomyces sp. NPDC006711 TaxID=3364762 RepID=UPI003687DF5E